MVVVVHAAAKGDLGAGRDQYLGFGPAAGGEKSRRRSLQPSCWRSVGEVAWRGIVGRLFREFAVTVSVAILISGVVSLTVSPMLCAWLIKHEHGRRRGRLYRCSEIFFDGCTRGYGYGLDIVLRHRLITQIITIATLAATLWLYVVVPKGFLPQQDTGFIQGQPQVATLFTQVSQYHVVMEVDPRFALSPEALGHLYVRSATTEKLVPLSLLGSLKTGVMPISINHQGSMPATTLSFNLKPGVALSDAVATIHGAEQAAGMPITVIGSFQGTAQAFQDSLRTQPWLILAAVIAVYIVLGVLYESAIHPLTIISTLPSAGLGALLALRLCGQDLSIMGMIGIILLIGIVKKNAIMMIDFALEAERNQGLSPVEAIRQACLPAHHDDDPCSTSRRLGAGARNGSRRRA
jgi:multidrug efflux pump subunit AcrB